MLKLEEPALSPIHLGGIKGPHPFAVIFNPDAGTDALLAYARGQLSILEDVLTALDDKAEDDLLPLALKAISTVASAAVDQAAEKLRNQYRGGAQ